MRARTVLLGLAGVAGSVLLGERLGSRPEVAYGDSPLAPCPEAPNCALVRVPLGASPAQVRAVTFRAVQAHQSWRTGWASSIAPTEAGLTATFALGPFQDRMTAAIEPDGAGGSVLWLRSGAGAGRSDLGVNRARVHQIADAVRAECRNQGTGVRNREETVST